MGDLELQIFADRLKEFRTSLNLTQAEFVKNIGITAAALSAYENNVKNPSVSVAKRIAEEYGVSIDWLCGLTDTKKHNDELTTYADLFRALVKIGDAQSMLYSWNVTYNWGYTMAGPVNETFASLISEDEKVVRFFEGWSQMRKLYFAGTIDKHLYQLWLNDQFKNNENARLDVSFDSGVSVVNGDC